MERRLIAILAADVVAYSRLMGRDEVGTLAALKKCEQEVIEPSVEAHGGQIVKRMGDGYLVEFPSTVACLEWTGSGESRTQIFRFGSDWASILAMCCPNRETSTEMVSILRRASKKWLNQAASACPVKRMIR